MRQNTIYQKAVLTSIVLIVSLSGCFLSPDPDPKKSVDDPIVADHTVVEQYDSIPQYWIDEVKKMWLDVPGESHSSGYRRGLVLLESIDPRFAVNVTESGTPEGYTDQHLRVSGATWGDVGSDWNWVYDYGEEDWYTSVLAVERTKAHLSYCYNNSLEIAAMGFGWCWDMTWHNTAGGGIDAAYQVHWAGSSVGGPEGDLRWGLDAGDFALTGNTISMDTYLDATQEYIDYSEANMLDTRVFFTTGPVDGGANTGEKGYQRYLKNDYIREYVSVDGNRVLFDYADILCWSDEGELNTTDWTDLGSILQSYPYIHPDNMLDLDGTYTEDGDHIGERGAVRLGKAMWWILARLSGWDG